MKTLSNTDVKGAREQVKDLEVFGNGDTFLLICKASSAAEGWMKSTKAMPVPNLGCVVQVTTQQSVWDYETDREIDVAVAEAVCFVPGADIVEFFGKDGIVVGRRLRGEAGAGGGAIIREKDPKLEKEDEIYGLPDHC